MCRERTAVSLCVEILPASDYAHIWWPRIVNEQATKAAPTEDDKDRLCVAGHRPRMARDETDQRSVCADFSDIGGECR